MPIVEKEKKSEKIIEYVKEEIYSKTMNKPIAKDKNEITEIYQVDFKKVEEITIQPKKNEGNKIKISKNILERVQYLEKHMNGEKENKEINNQEVVDEYMNIILDKPVFNKNKKFKKMIFTDV